MIDTHIHLDADQYADPSATIKRAREAGVRAVVVPGVGPASNRKVLALASRFAGFVHAALGFHPEHDELTDHDLETTVAALRRERDRIVAVGEVGLPWYGDGAPGPDRAWRAKRALEVMAALAHELDLALILHAPHQSAAEALAITRGAGVTRAVFHWHKSDEATTRAILNAGYFVSLTPEVVYRERDRDLAPRSAFIDAGRDRRPIALRRLVRGARDGARDAPRRDSGVARIKHVSFRIASQTFRKNAIALFRIRL